MLKVLILAFISIQLVQSTSFEETRDCLHGPEYWCKSVQNSRRCGAFKHCLDTVWSKHDKYLVNDVDNSCDHCVDCLRSSGASDSSKCSEIDLNLDEVADLFMESIPSVTICKLVNGCKQSNNEEETAKLSDCSLHPRKWCDNIENARKCNSLEYCKENIWSKLRPMVLADEHVKTDAQCGFCIWVFNKLHEILQQNITEFNMEQYLLGACTLFPSKDEQKMCTDAINDNFDEIYNLVRNSMDPGIICRVIKLCKDEHLTEKSPSKAITLVNNDKVNIKILNPEDVIVKSSLNEDKKQHLFGSMTKALKVKLIRTGGVNCELCSMVMAAAKHLINNKRSEDQVLGFIEKALCSRLGSLNSTCVEYVKTEGKQILDDLINDIEPSVICQKMGLCITIQLTSPTTKRFFDINVKDNSNCTLCKLVMTEVKTMLASKKTEEQMLDYIRKNLCEKSAQYSDMCKTVVTAYGPLLLEFLSNDINPSQVCQLIGMCQKSKETIENVESNQGCVLCEFLMTTLANFISQNSSNTEIQRWLEYTCELLPSTIRAECKQLVDQYEPIIVALLSSQVKPEKVCQAIDLCPKSIDFKIENINNIKSKLNEIQLDKIQDNTPQCVICEFILTTLNNYIEQNATAPEVEKWLEYVCNTVMPSTIKQECSSFVEQYGPIIIQLLSQQIKPDKVCTNLKLCSKATQKMPIHSIELTKQEPIVQKIDTTAVYCDVCQFTLQFIEFELNKDKSQQAIEKTLENVCKIAPQSMRDNCNSIIETYGPYLIKLLEAYGEPLSVCYHMKLCPNKPQEQVQIETKIDAIELKPANPQTKNDRLKLPIVDKLADTQCTLCLYVAEILDNFLKQNKTDEEIKLELEKVCNYFPGALKDQCLSFIDEYAVYVLELLADDLDPHTVCKQLKLCSENSQTGSVDFRTVLKEFRDKIMHKNNN